MVQGHISLYDLSSKDTLKNKRKTKIESPEIAEIHHTLEDGNMENRKW